MPHVFVTRFAVPREDPETAGRHCDPRWLQHRLDLFRRFYAPSVEPLHVPAVLLCGSKAAEYVATRIEDLSWARVVVQDRWRGGWTGDDEQILTRMDSDDAVHRDWIDALDQAPRDVEAWITKDFLRLGLESGRLHRYRRSQPSPLAAFRGGINPYAHDHRDLERHYRTHVIPGAYLLQVVHRENLTNRPPRFWRLDRRRSRSALEPFGVQREEQRGGIAVTRR
jgi:hypothetical protein